uniref:Uncharacterized protein n=1 Tax=Coccidioides posadasii RMSCC 3488 TaxID=454284 RepID=A0A0J6F9S8_COCPO|nr:hypothetical protein CPAG_03299 [Coccidioides posadasii RMSCC 3488]
MAGCHSIFCPLYGNELRLVNRKRDISLSCMRQMRRMLCYEFCLAPFLVIKTDEESPQFLQISKQPKYGAISRSKRAPSLTAAWGDLADWAERNLSSFWNPPLTSGGLPAAEEAPNIPQSSTKNWYNTDSSGVRSPSLAVFDAATFSCIGIPLILCKYRSRQLLGLPFAGP